MTDMSTATSPANALATAAGLMPAAVGLALHAQLNPVSEKSDAQEVADFAAALEQALQDVKKASEASKAIGKSADDLGKKLGRRGFWGAVKANLNGATDGELATMVQGLGASLHLTQSVVQVMLKIQTQKNRLLHSFSDALVEKITKIQVDTHTLDGNQRLAALAFLGELQTHIDEQIRQQNLVQSHEQWIDEHTQWRSEKDDRDAALHQWVAAIEAETGALKRQLAALEPRLLFLEESHRRSRSLRGILARNFLPFVALASSAAALSMLLMR